MKFLFKLFSLSFMGVGFDHVIVSQAHANIIAIEHWLKTVIGEGTDLTAVK